MYSAILEHPRNLLLPSLLYSSERGGACPAGALLLGNRPLGAPPVREFELAMIELEMLISVEYSR